MPIPLTPAHHLLPLREFLTDEVGWRQLVHRVRLPAAVLDDPEIVVPAPLIERAYGQVVQAGQLAELIAFLDRWPGAGRDVPRTNAEQQSAAGPPRTLEELLAQVCSHGPLESDAIDLDLRPAAGGQWLRLQVRHSSQDWMPLVQALLLRARLASRLGFRPSAIRLPRACRRYEPLIRGHSGLIARFGSPAVALFLPQVVLPGLVPDGPATVASTAGPAHALANRATRAVRQVVRAYGPDRWLTLDQVAEVGEVSQRTIQRHLASEGTSFAAIVAEERLRLVQRLLAESDLSLDQIAHRLGYSSASNLARSFRRRLGLSPTEYRVRQVVASTRFAPRPIFDRL